MPKSLNLIGKKFGKLTVIKKVKSATYPSGQTSTRLLCRCECGNKKIMLQSNLRTGDYNSCGFSKRKPLKNPDFIYHPLHGVWRGMIKRCHNKNMKEYINYGGRGIKVCKNWKKDAEIFIKWALNNGWKKELQIDRIDNDKGYFPKNIRFVTQRKNILNKRLLSSDNTSGYRGVSLCKITNKWKSYITIKGNTIFLGRYYTKEDAVNVRNSYIVNNNLADDYKIQ